ncbi:hypothetical protein Taro_019676 [Colocasia esculenta]|uniref:C2H2-type domain-containing protein n=1 Tax=Colocasia esculenta TaxID=4460 RepID=A0A843V2Z0_COLES|nr:hypothetical protein [Colocasia esculenta]
MREVASLTLNGLVPGWGTSCEDPSREPHSRCVYPERPFSCPVDDCHHSYRRKDHLSRHLLQHQGKLFMCPKGSCNRRFSIRSNMQRHVKELHEEESPVEGRAEKKYICPEIGCEKEFKYLSRLKKHEESHVKLEYVEVICGEPGCMKLFTNAECLKAHIKSCHQHVQCPTCGTQQRKKNFKRHLCIHEREGATEKIKCSFPRCLHTFSKKSNLTKHVKAVHLELRPFTCRVSGCGLKFPYKHVRDNHERSGVHTYVQGDFLEVDEQFRSKPKGGRKRKSVMVELLLRKRIAASPEEINMLQNGTLRSSQILGDRQEDGTSD